MSFGTKLKLCRSALGLSQQELADIVGSTKQIVSLYEKDERVPKVTTAAKYADAVRVPLKYLLCGETVESDLTAVIRNRDRVGGIELMTGGQESRGGRCGLSPSGPHSLLVHKGGDAEGHNDLHQADPKIRTGDHGAELLAHEIPPGALANGRSAPCRFAGVRRLAGGAPPMGTENRHFLRSGSIGRGGAGGRAAIVAGTVIEGIGALAVIVLVRRIAVVVVIRAGGAVVVATSGIGSAGMGIRRRDQQGGKNGG